MKFDQGWSLIKGGVDSNRVIFQSDSAWRIAQKDTFSSSPAPPPLLLAQDILLVSVWLILFVTTCRYIKIGQSV